MVLPVGRGRQMLQRWTRIAERDYHSENLIAVQFVPMVMPEKAPAN
jgi:protein-L-isoaspartate O-methyltransferase